MEQFELRNPILINGEERKVLDYDFAGLREEHLLDAIANCHDMASTSSALSETDSAFHLWLMIEAVISSNNDVDEADINRLKGADGLRAMMQGASFYRNSQLESYDKMYFREFGEVKVDFNSFTADMIVKADTQSRVYANSIQKPSVSTFGNDMAYHLFIGYHLISASSGISVEELRKLPCDELIQIMNAGKNFITVVLVEEYSAGSQQEESEKLSEDTLESITPVPES